MSDHWKFLDELIVEARELAGAPASRAMFMSEFCGVEERRFEIEVSLHPSDTRHPSGFNFNRDSRQYLLYWGGYGYELSLDRIRSPIDLLATLHHLCEKGWAGTNARHIRRLIEHVAKELDWDMYGRSAFKKRGSAADEERAKLTPQLRYAILKRDGFRCRACGNGAAEGVVLHIDHKVAIANGGTTEKENLQTLCSMCNFGKGRTR